MVIESTLCSGLLFVADRRVEKLMQRHGRLIRRRLIEFEMMTRKFRRDLQLGRVECMIGIGIDDKFDRNVAVLLAGYPPAVASGHHVAALVRRIQIVAFADQDQRGDGQVALYIRARWVERNRSSELVWRGSLDRAAFDRAENRQAAPRESDCGNARGIDRWMLR